MTLTAMKRLKQELGFTNEWIAEKSGVPLGTVQKVFSEQVKSPRKETVDKLSHFFAMVMCDEERDSSMVHDVEVAYSAIKKNKVSLRTFDGMVMDEEGVYRLPDMPFTIEDLAYTPEGKNFELIDGVLYEVNAPGWNHQIVIREVMLQMYDCMRRTGKRCEILFAPFCVQVSCDETTMVQPDLFVICGDSDKPRGRYLYGAPDLIMEVLSDTNRKKDMTVKMNKYWNSGVREYWMVDYAKGKVIVYDFQHDDLSHTYTIDEKVPVGISDGECEVDFSDIADKLKLGNDE